MSRGSTFYVNYYEYQNKYDLKQLLDNDKYAQKDIKRLQEEIEKLQAYRTEIFKQAQIVANTEFKTVVKVYRQQYDSVFYFISVYEVPVWEDLTNFHNHIQGKKIFNERYTGKERHNVLKKAAALAKEYNATLIKNF